jgi:hypothetical protein
MVPIDKLVLDPSLQLRAVERLDKIEEYGENLNRLPPAKAVLTDEGKAYVYDGFHTLKAAVERGRANYPVVLSGGTWDDAFLLAVGANATHGIDRTPEDKRRAVRAVCAHPTYGQWSARRIAEACQVSEHLTASVKEEYEREVASRYAEAQAPGKNGKKPRKEKPKKVIGRDGKVQAAKKKPRKKPAGKVKFDFGKKFNAPFGQVYRLPDELYRAFGHLNEDGTVKVNPAHRAMLDHLNRFKEVFRKQYKTLSKEEAPDE